MVILCFQPQVYEHARTTYEGYREDPPHPRYSLYVLSERSGRQAGAVGELGIGGPATVRVVEELIVRGTETSVTSSPIIVVLLLPDWMTGGVGLRQHFPYAQRSVRSKRRYASPSGTTSQNARITNPNHPSR